MFLKRRKRRQDLLGVIQSPRRNRTAQKNEGVAPPIKKPRIARNHRLVIAAADEEQIQRRRESLHQRHIRDSVGRRHLFNLSRKSHGVLVAADKRRRIARTEVARNPSWRIEITRRLLSALGLVRMRHGIRPLRLLMHLAAAHLKLHMGCDVGGNRRLAAIGLRDIVETSAFQIRTEHDTHTFVEALRRAVAAPHRQARRVRAGRELKTERERNGTPHARRNGEAPFREASGGICVEALGGVGVDRVRIALILEPRATTRPDHDPVRRTRRIRVRREK